eukprot:1784716-Lingulodinium_polyedra.AAC.1
MHGAHRATGPTTMAASHRPPAVAALPGRALTRLRPPGARGHGGATQHGKPQRPRSHGQFEERDNCA